MAIIVTGFGLSKPKVVIGRGVFVIPIIQRADRLNMRLLKVDVKTPDNGVKNQEGVSLWLDSVVTVQVFFRELHGQRDRDCGCKMPEFQGLHLAPSAGCNQ